jgi:hypothetical protein
MMSPFAVAFAVLGGSFGFAVVGMVLHRRVSDPHLDEKSRDVVKLVMGLIATISALVLSLLISSSSASYNQQVAQLRTLSANLILLDRALESYGPDANAARAGLRDSVRQTHDRIWSPDGVRPEHLNSTETQSSVKANVEQLQSLTPKTDLQRMMQARIIQETESVGRSRLLMFEALGDSISTPFLTVLLFWICMLFLGLGLLARFNVIVTGALLVGSVSVAGAIFLILEMSNPYAGLMQMSDQPLLNAMAEMDR